MSLRITKENLAALLRNAAATIEGLDSVEGSIGWIEGEPGTFHVYGAYRFGNVLGQGSVRILGTEENARATAERERGLYAVEQAAIARRELREAVKPIDFRPMGQVRGEPGGLVAARPPLDQLPDAERVAVAIAYNGRLPRYKVWLADEDQLGDLVLRTGCQDPPHLHTPRDVPFGGASPTEVAITAYRRLNSTDSVMFIVKNFDNGRWHTVVVTPAGATSCVEKLDASRDDSEPL